MAKSAIMKLGSCDCVNWMLALEQLQAFHPRPDGNQRTSRKHMAFAQKLPDLQVLLIQVLACSGINILLTKLPVRLVAGQLVSMYDEVSMGSINVRSDLAEGLLQASCKPVAML